MAGKRVHATASVVANAALVVTVIVTGLAWFVYKLDWEWQVSLLRGELASSNPQEIAAISTTKQACERLLWAATLWAVIAVIVRVRTRDWCVQALWLAGTVILLIQCQQLLLVARDLVLAIGFRS